MGRISYLVGLAWWRVKRWHLLQMVYEASCMTQTHYNIARDELWKHDQRKPRATGKDTK